MVQVLARYSSRFLGTSTSWGGEVGICAAVGTLPWGQNWVPREEFRRTNLVDVLVAATIFFCIVVTFMD
jgi:hypothetical protein